MGRADGGWVKSYPKGFNGDIGDNVYCWWVWSHLLHNARWKPGTVRLNGKPRQVPAGSIVIGIRVLAKRAVCSKDTISRALKYLRERDTIETIPATEGTLVTINNWEKYQSVLEFVATPNETPTGREPDTNRTLTDPSEEVRSKKEELRKKSVGSDVERKRSPVGAIPELSASALTLKALEDVPQQTQRNWLEAYPDASWLAHEIAKAMCWLDVNPQRRPKRLSRFLGNWLAKGWEQYRKTIPSVTPIRRPKRPEIEAIEREEAEIRRQYLGEVHA